MPADLLAELKKLQYQRSESSPFASHVEFHTWADKVMPLLSFSPKLHSQFSNAVSSSETSRILKIPQQEIQNINSAIGILNQAITLLEVNPVPDTAPNPTSNTPNGKIKPFIAKVAERVLVALIVGVIGYASLHYLLPLIL